MDDLTTPPQPAATPTETAVLHLTKHHGLGNDFLVALAADNPDLVPDPARGARAVRPPHRASGADGLLYALAPSEPEHDACMVLLNSDGSEAEISGNGIRCLGQALLRAEGQQRGRPCASRPPAVSAPCAPCAATPTPSCGSRSTWARPDPGPELGPATAGLRGATGAATVDIGNPHLVLLVDDPDRVDLGGRRARRSRPTTPAASTCTSSPSRPATGCVCGSGNAAPASPMACGSGRGRGDGRGTGLGPGRRPRARRRCPEASAVVERSDSTMLLTGPAVFVAEVRVP